MPGYLSVYTSDGTHRPSRRRWIWWLVGLAIIALLGWYVLGPFSALRKIQESDSAAGSGSFFGFLGNIVSGRQLAGEAEGRVNILLLGVGGSNHPGGTLADTIQLVSVNTKTKQVAVMSIPRDLRVTIPGAGVNKINYAHAYGELSSKTTGGGPAVTKKVVSTILDLPIHYYVRMDFEGFTKLVDALGGVDIFVEKAINDPFYPAPDMIHYDPFKIAAGWHHMDGATALKYVRSRETTSDFDRSRRQQQMLQALKERALSLNILVSPKKVNEIASILGNHVRTDLATWEIARAIELASRDAGSYTIITRVLAVGPEEPLMSVNDGGYYLVPRTGNFKEIQTITENIFTEPLLKEEAAKIEIVNASGDARLLLELSTTLKNQGFTVTSARTARETSGKTTLFDYSGGTKPKTGELLAKQFGVVATSHTKPSSSAVDFTVIVGTDYLNRTL